MLWYISILIIVIVAVLLYSWQISRRCILEGEQNLMNGGSPSPPPTQYELSNQYPGSAKLNDYIKYVYENDIESFTKILRFILYKTPEEVQTKMLNKLCKQLNEKYYDDIDISESTDLKLNVDQMYRCGSSEKLSSYFYYLSENDKNNDLLEYILTRAPEQIKTLLSIICNKLSNNEDYENLLTATMKIIATKAGTEETEELIGSTELAPAPAPINYKAPAPAPEDSYEAPSPEDSYEYEAPATSLYTKEEKKMKASFNVAGFVDSMNVQGCDANCLNSKLSYDDFLKIDASYNDWTATMYMGASTNASVRKEHEDKKKALTNKIISYCAAPSPGPPCYKKTNIPTSLQGYILSNPSLNLNIGCNHLFLQKYFDNYEDTRVTTTPFTREDLYTYLNKLNSSEEKSKFLNWLCYVIQMSATQRDINSILTTLININYDEQSIKFENPLVSSPLASPVSASLTNSVNAMPVMMSVEKSMGAPAYAKLVEETKRLNAPQAAAPDINWVMNHPGPAAFKKYTNFIEPNNTLFSQDLDCERIITPYMDYNPNPEFISTLYHKVTDLSNIHQYQFFKSICNKYSSDVEKKSEAYVYNGTPVPERTYMEKEIPKTSYQTINDDLSYCYQNKEYIQSYRETYKPYYSNPFDFASNWCQVKRDFNVDEKDSNFNFKMYQALTPSAASTQSDLIQSTLTQSTLTQSASETQNAAPIVAKTVVNKPPAAKEIKFVIKKNVYTPVYKFKGYVTKMENYIGTLIVYTFQPQFIGVQTLPTIKSAPFNMGPNERNLLNTAVQEFLNQGMPAEDFHFKNNPYYLVYATDGNNKCVSIQAIVFDAFKDIIQNNISSQKPTFSNNDDKTNNITVALWSLKELDQYLFPNNSPTA